MTIQGLDIIISEGLQLIKLDSPSTRNGITLEILKAITDALNSSACDDSIVLTVITGVGEYFSSGYVFITKDKKLERKVMDEGFDKYVEAVSIIFVNFVNAFIDYPKLLVAVVNGPAIGVAVTILPLCDVVLASDKATFQTPFINLGLCPEACSSYTFPRIMGFAKAGQMLYLNYKMKVEEALECGLISNIFEHSKLNEIFHKLQKITELPVKSIMCSKELIRGSNREKLHKVNMMEKIQLAQRFRSDDFIIAILNFSNRRSKL